LPGATRIDEILGTLFSKNERDRPRVTVENKKLAIANHFDELHKLLLPPPRVLEHTEHDNPLDDE
jgi:hypothetical protein